MDKLYSISKTSEILDITPKTLRIWDKEGKLKPVLTSGGHRRYKESDIKKIINGVNQINKDANLFDGRPLDNEQIEWTNIKIGDVVLEGNINLQYRVLTDVDGTYWEYFDENDGYYHTTSPEYCHWKIIGQKDCHNAKIIKIEYCK